MNPRIALGIAAALWLFCAALAPARAGTADGLRAILALIPASPATPHRGTIEYADLGVAAAMTGNSGLDAVVALAQRFAVLPKGEVMGMAEAWPRKAGFGLAEVEAVARAGEPPGTVTFYRLAPSIRIEALKAVWTERGFRERPSAAGPLWGRGEAGRLDVSKVDREDPFGGVLGQSSFLLPLLPMLAESAYPEGLVAAAAARAAGGLAMRADAAALLAALDRNGGRLLQALLLPAPVEVMSAANGLPPYAALVIADIEHGARAETLVLVAYPDCAAARAAESEVAARWAVQAEPLRPAAPAWSMNEGQVCVLAGRIAAPGAAETRALGNPSYRTVINALYRRDLTALAIRRGR